ncbi:XdhC family protein [Flavihumibacter petaseus]|uniref:Putative XdhC family protein n=1 Tax=Flavihumibacter petaseus NBRC 106054 TaxID=1220578 RepID=A0A0E9MTW8_9BACT|nr:XdhC/CoxI family protein [Flavihumibacter petaseus]GAO41009.1 putative XdhC family protein [Flavihumibacter petaseus NBRC 106054]
MTKEIHDIINAYHKARREGKQMALATVVHVEGSSYRRPGARMLVEEDGKMTGAISGGCLEGDALRKALLAIHQQANRLVTYNTLEDDMAFGVQLGCNGIVHILFEPVDPSKTNHPVTLLEQCASAREPLVLATVFNLNRNPHQQFGTCLLSDGEKSVHAGNTPPDQLPLVTALTADAIQALDTQSSRLEHYPATGDSAFLEYLQPAISLYVVGGGNDALPLAAMASLLGWPVTVIDGRITHGNRQRFPAVENIINGKPQAVLPQLQIDHRSAVVLMTHNYHYDLAMLKGLLPMEPGYIGSLGPKSKFLKMLDDLRHEGIEPSQEQLEGVYGPTGLDIGAETAEEIALSIIAEIKAVMCGRKGNFLRNRQNSIHHHVTEQ